jgi:DNA gyrase subunit A
VKQRALIRKELLALLEKYQDYRRTRINPNAAGDFDEEDFVDDERVLIPITQRGYIKRVPSRVYRSQGRGGRGVIGMDTKEEDEVVEMISANSLDTLLFFTDKGKVYQEKVYQIPEADRTARGALVAGILPLDSEERVTAVQNVGNFKNGRYFTMVTRDGYIKRVSIQEFASVRPSGLIAISLEEGDELCWVQITQGDQDVLIVTKQGQGIRFSEEDVRAMGRTARGVIAIRLKKGDHVAAVEVVEPEADLFVASLKGYGRRTSLEEFPSQGRAGKGVRAYKMSKMTGPVISARVVQESDEITLISEGGIVLRTKVQDVPQMGRYSRGVQMMDLKEGDRVASIARLVEEEPESDTDEG